MSATSLDSVRRAGRKFVAPGAKVMGRLRYAHKFAVIGVIVLACLGFVGFSYLGEVSTQVDFSQKERVGVVYVGPAADLVIALVGARTAAVAHASGSGSADLATARRLKDFEHRLLSL